LGDKLASLYPSSSIDSAIQSAQQFSDDDYKDIFHFAQLVRDNVEEAKIEAETVFNLKNKVVLYRGELNIQNAQGLSIYLTKSGFANYQASYSSLLFGQIATGWINFLKKLNGL
jgi:hypothetical protein